MSEHKDSVLCWFMEINECLNKWAFLKFPQKINFKYNILLRKNKETAAQKHVYVRFQIQMNC